VRTVTSNTRADGEELLRLATRLPLQISTTTYDFGNADQALADLAHGRFAGAAVLRMG
jgi:propanol-preferring alcohol dehydrogenase